MTDTPRTDNAALSGDGTTVPADFAADLERELNEARADAERLREALRDISRQPEGNEESAQAVAREALKETK
jgi:hypothetical protein